MGELVDYIAPKYKYLVRIPGTGNPLLTTLAVSIVLGAIGWISGEGSLFAIPLMMASMLAIPSVCDLILEKLSTKFTSIVSFRRLSHITLLETYIISSGLVLDIVTYRVTGVVASLILLAASLSAYLRITVLSSFATDAHMKVASLGLLTPATRAIVLPFATSQAIVNYASMLLSVTIGGGLGLLFVWMADRPITGMVSPLKIASAFVADLLAGDAKPFEEAIKSICDRKDGYTDAILFRDPIRGARFALVIPSFHPGPYRNVGSSMLPYFVERVLHRRGIKGVFLKGCSTHDSNVVSKEATMALAEEVGEAVSREFNDEFSSYGAIGERVEVNGVKLVSLKIGEHIIAIPTLHPSPMEDMPEEVVNVTSSHKVIVIDAHNSFMKGFRSLSSEDLGRLKHALSSLEVNSVFHEGRLMVGIKRIVPPHYGPSDGMGPGGFTMIGLAVDGYKFALVVVDANNATPDVRDAVISRLRELGWNDAELVTTDTHFVNGIRLGGIGYVPLGEKISASEVREICEELSDGVLREMAPIEAKCIRIYHSDVEVFSSDTLESLADKARLHIMLYFGIMGLSALLPLVLL